MGSSRKGSGGLRRGDRDVQNVPQKLGRELGPIAEQEQQRLVLERGHPYPASIGGVEDEGSYCTLAGCGKTPRMGSTAA
jgi:hypothetical protein